MPTLAQLGNHGGIAPTEVKSDVLTMNYPQAQRLGVPPWHLEAIQ